MRALRDYRASVVQESKDRWSIYVQGEPELIAEIAAAAGLAGCRAVDESELVAAGISHP
jgi:hypothetical protein